MPVCVSVVNGEKCWSYPQCKSIYPQCKEIHQMSSCTSTHNTLQLGGGYSGVNFGHPKSDVFLRGGIPELTLVIPNLMFSWGGYSGVNFIVWKIWTKIYCSARNLLVHHSSLSHTMCVETNYTPWCMATSHKHQPQFIIFQNTQHVLGHESERFKQRWDNWIGEK